MTDKKETIEKNKAAKTQDEGSTENQNNTPEDCDARCSSCDVSDCGSRTEAAKLLTHPQAKIKKVIAVVSGKGGVGKSLVTTQLARVVHAEGYKVGVLDADITGPTMARAFGIKDRLSANENGIIPQETSQGIKVVSTNMVLPEETTPVLWRGAIITNLITQFFSEVLWGELDYLFIDMPPGTGDAALTVYQSIPVDGVVVVTAPQDLVSMIVGKAINMAHMMEVPVLGIIENMSYFECPDCKGKHAIFGKSDLAARASQYDIKLSATLPIDPSFADCMDKGKAEQINIPELRSFIKELLLEEQLVF